MIRRFWPYLLLVALTVLFLGDVWFNDRMLVMRDFVFTFEPMRLFFANAIRGGVFPIWSSSDSCGMPIGASPYHSTFYPPNIVYLLRPVQLAIRLDWTFHFTVVGFGCFLLCRYWRLRTGPALFTAVSLAFSTVLITLAEFSISLNCIVWMPLLLLFTSKVIDGTAEEVFKRPVPKSWRDLRIILLRNASYIAGMAIVSALQVCACGEIFYYCGLLVGAYVLARWFWHGNWRTVGISMGQFVLAGGLGVALAAPQLFLTAECLPLSARATGMDSGLHMTSAHPAAWLALLLPYLYGRPGYPDAYWGKTIYEFVYGTIYVGILPLIGLIFCWLGPANRGAGREVRERRFLAYFFAGTALAGLMMAAGKYTPLYAFLHHWLPGLGKFRFPTKFYLLVAFALAMLGGLGMQALLQSGEPSEPREARNRIWLWKLAAGLFGVFLLGYLVCLFDTSVLLQLMAHPGTPSVEQINSVRFDYALAAVFTLLGLGLFGMLAFRQGSQLWIQGGIVAVAFLNLCVISRKAQPTGPAELYSRRPLALEKRIGNDPMYRYLSTYYGAQQYIYGENRRELWEWAVDSGATNHLRAEGFSDLAPGSFLGRYARFFGATMSTPQPVGGKMADMLSLRYLIGGAPFEQILWGNASREIRIQERPSALPRAFVVSQWRSVSGEEAVLQTIATDSFDPRREAIVEPLPGETALASPEKIAFSDQAGEVRSFVDQQNSVTLEVSAKSRALLVLGDTWYPGWTATVDGIKTPIFQTNYLFRGVFLEPGTHRVEFSYWPTHLTAGLWCFGLAAAACVALVCVSFFAPSGACCESARE